MKARFIAGQVVVAALLLCIGAIAVPFAFAHADGTHRHAFATAAVADAEELEETAFGKPGAMTKVDRTIAIDMRDTMRFSPQHITVRQGETIRFMVKNHGKILHEMVLGTMDELKQHHALMKQHPGMEHDEPQMVHVKPGKTGKLVWQFTKPGEFHYACLIPGHFEAGMTGKITVTKGNQ